MAKPLFSLSYSIAQSPELIWEEWQKTDFWRQSWLGKSQHFYIPALSSKITGTLKLQPLLPQYTFTLSKFQPNDSLEFTFSSLVQTLTVALSLTGSDPTVLNISVNSYTNSSPSGLIFDWLAKPYFRQYSDRVAYLCRELQVEETKEITTQFSEQSPSTDSSAPIFPSDGFFMWHLINNWQNQLDLALKNFHLTSTQWLLLFNLVKMNESGEETTTSTLAKSLQLHEVHVSDVIKVLVKKHLVHKLKLQSDQRKFKLTATSQGKLLAVEAHTTVIQTERKFFSSLMGSERQQFARLITKLAQPQGN